MQERRILEALLGTYVGLLSVPAAALFTRTLDAGSADVLVAVGLGVAVVVAALARSVGDLADTLASAPVAVATVVPPLAYLPYLILATPPESPAAFASVVGLLAVLPGIAVPVGGAIVRNRRLREAATEEAVVTVGGGEDTDDGTNWQLVAGVAVAATSFVAFGVVVLLGGEVTTGTITPALGGISTWVLLLGDDGTTEVAITDRGLRIDRGFTRWENLEGYRLGDDEIELLRCRWYLPARSFEREEIDDEDALIECLGRFLPRVDQHGRVELAARE
jgi:hypothetical protein